MKIAFLGLGKMGSSVARLLLKSGHSVTVWNRTAAKAQSLAEDGAMVAERPSDAVRDAEIVFSMLMDDAALESAVFGTAGFLQAMTASAIHVSLSTISVKLSQRLTVEHNLKAQHFIAAPVFGRPNIAEEGKLWIVVGGESEPVARVKPIFEQMSRGITVVSDEPWRAHALKLGGNFMITAMIEAVSESMVYAKVQGIEPGVFLETVNSALFQSPLYAAYGKVMLHPPEEPGSTIALGAKDTRLFREAAEAAGVATPLAEKFAADLRRASEAGWSDEDWAAGLYKLAQNENERTR